MAGPRTPLLRPDRYFAAHDDSPPLSHAALAVAVATAIGAALLIDQLAATLDVPVTVDNPAYPGEGICENSAVEDTPSGCEQPPTGPSTRCARRSPASSR